MSEFYSITSTIATITEDTVLLDLQIRLMTEGQDDSLCEYAIQVVYAKDATPQGHHCESSEYGEFYADSYTEIPYDLLRVLRQAEGLPAAPAKITWVKYEGT